MDSVFSSVNRSAYPPPVPPESVTYGEFLRQNPAEGNLKIQASRAHRALPTAGVEVVVARQFLDQRVLFFRGKTDEDGLIDSVILPAPPRRDSLAPSQAQHGARYQVFARCPGFLPESHEAEIFAGVTSILPISMRVLQEDTPWL